MGETLNREAIMPRRSIAALTCETGMANRLGFLSALGLFLVGIAYAAVVGIGVAEAGLTEPIVDPILAIMEVLTLVAAPFIVMLMVAIHGYARHDRKLHGMSALAFGTLAAGVTAGVHFVTLTAGRQSGFAVLEWPSTLYALELLAWDLFLGLSLLFAAPVFVGPGMHAVARWWLTVAGALCLAGTAGPVVGDMAIQRIGILGYGVVLPVASAALAVVFARTAGEPGTPVPPQPSANPATGEERGDRAQDPADRGRGLSA